MSNPTEDRKKILSLEELNKLLGDLKFSNKTIAHCHGVFDLLHIGHIRHLKEASELADILIVSITSDRFVNKGINRPEFNFNLRAEVISSLSFIDFVIVSDFPTAIEMISIIKPNYYVKGPDYSDDSKDISGGIIEEKRKVESYGGKIYFTKDIQHSSSNLLNKYFSKLSDETIIEINEIKSRLSFEHIFSEIEKMNKLSVLVIGEAIIDEYQYCSAIGKSSKSPTLAVKLDHSELSLGGSLSIAKHLEDFTNNVSVISTVGDDYYSREFIPKKISPNLDLNLVISKDQKTIIKRRFVETYFFHKLLEVYDSIGCNLSKSENEYLLDTLERLISKYDVVLIADFGHKMMSNEMIDIVQNSSKFLSVNVQMNAANTGFNTLSKYSKADYVSITESELRLDYRDNDSYVNDLINDAADRLGTNLFSVTRGSLGSIVHSKSDGIYSIPALINSNDVIDRVGAGDAYFAITSVLASLQPHPEMLGLLGNMSAAYATRIVSNNKSINKLEIIKSIESLLK